MLITPPNTIVASCEAIPLSVSLGRCRQTKRWSPTKIWRIRFCLICRDILFIKRRAAPKVECDEGDHSRRRLWYAALSGDLGGQQAAAANIRQADDLLPADDIDARGYPRDPRYYDARRSAPLRGASRGRQPMGLVDCLCRAAAPRRTGAGLSDRARLHRPRQCRPGARRQHILWRRLVGDPATGGAAAARRHRLRLPGPQPRSLWRG